MNASLAATTIDTLQRLFGHSTLRPGQEQVIGNTLAGLDSLAIMPTGSGKSLTYQLPAMLLPGATVVVSPLIALMKDQVESLPKAVRQRTALINSTLTFQEMQERLEDVRQGRIKLIYVAPERLRDRDFLQALTSAQVSLLVVDEAHCISLWGQDFRPDYLFIPKVLVELGQPPVLAVTATATPAMAEQIATALHRPLELVRLSLFRSNLNYEVHNVASRDEKVRQLINICHGERGSGIVYVSSRRDAEQIAAILRDNHVQAIHYHAGMEPELRAQHQDRFMKGSVRVVVATIAFGMGVDKANVRFIVHFSPPSSLEAYAQESGRAGRDGQPARCLLLSAPNDGSRLKTLARRDALEIEDLRTVYRSLKTAATGRWALLDRQQMLALTGGNADLNERVALGLLEQAGMIARHPDAPRTLSFHLQSENLQDQDPNWQRMLTWLGDGPPARPFTINVAAACTALELNPVDLDRLLANHGAASIAGGLRTTCLELLPDVQDSSGRVTAMLEGAAAAARQRVDQVLKYAANRTICRHAMLAAQFGERLDPCGASCDVCLGQLSSQPIATGSERIDPTAADALLVLQAVQELPFPMGRTGLVRLLLGSSESRVRADRAASFGRLSHLTISSAGRLVDRLVEQGYLHRDLEHEYKLINLTARSGNATLKTLEQEFVASGHRPNKMRSTEPSHHDGVEDESLNLADQALYDRLAAWRLETAREQNVPAYVVAHNRLLRAISTMKPLTRVALQDIPGCGPAKAGQYGEVILAIVRG